MPLAYSAPTTLPALVPATTAGVKPLASSILITPMWAKPLAAPPPRAMPILIGAAAWLASGAGVTGLGGLLPQAARASRPPQASGRKKTFKCMRKETAFIGKAV
ncbi:hypothetical protein D3C79_975250 [compost metagenome]